ncbi:MAG: GWxTD domain-containing protein [Bacteroidia bacterium]|jgi:GWxTD domain-containing protein|nr:GWxTD domain-containing protein [Bacteroidia bacterium]
MKRILLFAATCVVFTTAMAREVTANLTWCAFSTPDDKTYIETYLSIIGNSVTYKPNSSGRLQAAVNVVLTITSGDGKNVEAVREYTLNSPEAIDTTNLPNFLDLQRFTLKPGAYTIQLIISDKHRGGQERKIMNARSMFLDIDPDSVSISGVEFVESARPTTQQNLLSKSGMDLVPYVSEFFPGNMNQLQFYAELYNTPASIPADQKFVVLYSIESVISGQKMSDYNAFSKHTPQPVNPLLQTFDITKLPGGNYILVIEVRNAANRLLAVRRAPFERFNPNVTFQLTDVTAVDVSTSFIASVTSPDTLREYIRCLRPISTESEKDFAETQIKTGDVKLMQQYILNFWLSRNEKNPQGAWLTYKAEVDKVNREFGTPILRGYDSDRGRVYLQYGPPDQRTFMTNEPSSYPYEIWQYYTIRGNPAMPQNGAMTSNQPGNTTQTNKRFVFANFDLATNNYQLIHSDARGEVRDDRWRVRLTKRDTSPRNVDQTRGNNHWGSQADDLYTNPR